MIHWKKITTPQELDAVVKLSASSPVLLFKHSYRCSISAAALSRLERTWNLDENEVKPFLIDVISDRPVSNEIAALLEVRHESPQALVLKDGQCTYNASHLAINMKDIAEAIKI